MDSDTEREGTKDMPTHPIARSWELRVHLHAAPHKEGDEAIALPTNDQLEKIVADALDKAIATPTSYFTASSEIV